MIKNKFTCVADKCTGKSVPDTLTVSGRHEGVYVDVHGLGGVVTVALSPKQVKRLRAVLDKLCG